VNVSSVKNNSPIWKIALGLLALYLIWGSVYLMVATAVDFWPPFLLVGVRFFLAGVCILAFALWRGRPWPSNRTQWVNVSIVGLLMVTGTNGAITWSLSMVDSGVAAVLVATMPLWLILLESLRPTGDRPHWIAWPGFILGLTGIAILVQTNFGDSGNFTALFGQMLVIGAAFLWAAGSIFIRQFETPSSVMMTTALQMIIGSTILIIIGIAKGEVPHVPHYLEFWPSMSFLFMTFISSIVGYSTYQWLIVNARPALVATYAYVNPIIAVLLGVWIGHETFTLQIFWGSLLVIFAAFLIQRVRR
jgi:drug/metabolite transporter (DMT)-like permease